MILDQTKAHVFAFIDRTMDVTPGLIVCLRSRLVRTYTSAAICSGEILQKMTTRNTARFKDILALIREVRLDLQLQQMI